MLKVTSFSGVIFLKILLFNGCTHPQASSREELRYENKLDTQYERKIDSAYARMGRDCDSTLDARWRVLSDSILQSHHVVDSLVSDSLDRIQQFRDLVVADSLAWEDEHKPVEDEHKPVEPKPRPKIKRRHHSS